ncbi:hypothetical protein [Synechococcus sp. M16CYN]|uniref:hypothetical protein n=1 Tax=Synechococcus sp. M16CYN TaxID=3103139 RepID=UPI00333EFB99
MDRNAEITLGVLLGPEEVPGIRSRQAPISLKGLPGATQCRWQAQEEDRPHR